MSFEQDRPALAICVDKAPDTTTTGSSELETLLYSSELGKVPMDVSTEISKSDNLKTLCLFRSVAWDIRAWGTVCTAIRLRLTMLYIDVFPDGKLSSFRQGTFDVFDRLCHLRDLELHCRRVDLTDKSGDRGFIFDHIFGDLHLPNLRRFELVCPQGEIIAPDLSFCHVPSSCDIRCEARVVCDSAIRRLQAEQPRSIECAAA